LIVAGDNLTDRVFVETNLLRGNPNYYTHDLEGVWWDPWANIIRGWVHIETHVCEIDDFYFHGEIYYVESYDGGYTFSPAMATYDPPNAYAKCPIEYPGWVYPYDIFSKDWVITSPGQVRKTDAQILESGTKNSGTGAHFFAQNGEWLYIYYTDMWAESGLYDVNGTALHRSGACVARSNVRDGGKPGTWLKWYNGSFSEPGVDGRCNPMPNTSGTATSWVPIFNPLTQTNDQVMINIPPNWAGSGAATLNGYNFTRLNGPFFLSLRGNRPEQLSNARLWFQGYQSLAVDENNQAWLYAMAILSDIGVRQVIRYPISFFQSPTSAVCGGRIALVRYRSLISSQKVSVQIQLKDTDYWTSESVVAYVSLCTSRLSIQLAECYIVDSGISFLAQDSECDALEPSPDGTASTVQYLGPAGFVRTSFASGLVALYRCWFPTQRYFDVALASAGDTDPCNALGGVTQLLLGYAMPNNSVVGVFSGGSLFWDSTSRRQNITDPETVTIPPVPTFVDFHQNPGRIPSPTFTPTPSRRPSPSRSLLRTRTRTRTLTPTRSRRLTRYNYTRTQGDYKYPNQTSPLRIACYDGGVITAIPKARYGSGTCVEDERIIITKLFPMYKNRSSIYLWVSAGNLGITTPTCRSPRNLTLTITCTA